MRQMQHRVQQYAARRARQRHIAETIVYSVYFMSIMYRMRKDRVSDFESRSSPSLSGRQGETPAEYREAIGEIGPLR